jgi:hypothetical protein
MLEQIMMEDEQDRLILGGVQMLNGVGPEWIRTWNEKP